MHIHVMSQTKGHPRLEAKEGTVMPDLHVYTLHEVHEYMYMYMYMLHNSRLN